jgi:hypothetical protein
MSSHDFIISVPTHAGGMLYGGEEDRAIGGSSFFFFFFFFFQSGWRSVDYARESAERLTRKCFPGDTGDSPQIFGRIVCVCAQVCTGGTYEACGTAAWCKH